MVELPLLEAARRTGELEGPQETVRHLKVRADRRNLVNKVFHRNDAVLAEVSLEDAVVRDRNALLVHLDVTALVNELANRLEVRLAPCHVWRDQLKHLLSGRRQLHEDTVVNLAKAQQLHDLTWLGWNVADTTQTDHESHTRLGWHKEVALRLGQATQADLLTLRSLVLLHVLFSALKDNLTLLLAGLYCVSLWIFATV